jgi:hypothetical protein
MSLKVILFILVTLPALCSCAGPYTPFGAVDPWHMEQKRIPAAIKQNVIVKTYPEYQIFHRPYRLVVEVFDPNDIPKDFKLHFYHNGIKSQHWWKTTTTHMVGPKNMVVIIDNFKLMAGREHDVSIMYQRGDNGDFSIYHYLPPRCHLNDNMPVANEINFNINDEFTQLVHKVAVKHGRNPAMLAGLVAQESAFNPKAVSYAKALGLTQVTDLAESHILTNSPHWPQYPGIEKMSYPRLKYLVLTNKINSKNEWRLDQKMSLMGGLRYIDYLEKYWMLDGNKKLLENTFNRSVPLTDVILASYNSGPYRVKKAIRNSGSNWRRHNSLKAANHYVDRVKSYCFEFAQEQSYE